MTYDHWKTTNPQDEFLGPDPDDEEVFDVWQWFADGYHDQIGEGLDAREAVALVYNYVARPAALIGIIKRITIVACEDDATVFEWTFGKGVTFK